MREEAYLRWEATWFKIWEDDEEEITINTNQKYYTVKAGDSWMKIAKAYAITFTSLFELNRWEKVRLNEKWDEWLYWKTSRILYPWDKLLIPDWFTEPVKTEQINRTGTSLVYNAWLYPWDYSYNWRADIWSGIWTAWQPLTTEEDWFIYVY